MSQSRVRFIGSRELHRDLPKVLESLEEPNSRFVLTIHSKPKAVLIGADAFAEIRTWHRWRDVARSVCFLVVSRPGHEYTVPAGVCVERLDTLELPVSSSEIRRALAAGQDPPEVPAAVLDYTKRDRKSVV